MFSKNKFGSYKARFIRFLEVFQFEDWHIKVYSISRTTQLVAKENMDLAKSHLGEWLEKHKHTELQSYQIATLILHEFSGGCFAITNWWVDENMVQNYVYLKPLNEPDFSLYSDTGIATCVWEMAIWWHERNAWVEHVLKQADSPDFKAYLENQLNIEI